MSECDTVKLVLVPFMRAIAHLHRRVSGCHTRCTCMTNHALLISSQRGQPLVALPARSVRS